MHGLFGEGAARLQRIRVFGNSSLKALTFGVRIVVAIHRPALNRAFVLKTKSHFYEVITENSESKISNGD